MSAVPAISIPQIPANLRVPLFYAAFSSVNAGNSVPDQRALIVAQTKTAAPAVPTFVPSAAWAAQVFGPLSEIAQMIAAYRQVDPFGELWCLPLPALGGATAATWTIGLSGTTTAAGTLFLYLAGTLVQVPVPAGTTPAALAPLVAGAINASGAPVTAAVDGVTTSQIDLTAANLGTASNSLNIQLNYLGSQGGQATPTGLSVAITSVAAGTGIPSLTTLDAQLGDQQYDFIAMPWSDQASVGAFTTLMQDTSGRWSWERQIYGGVFTAAAGSSAALITLGNALNDQHMVVVGYETTMPVWAPAVAASFCAAFAAASKADPARPSQTLALPGLLAPQVAGRFSLSLQNTLLNTGIALMRYNRDGTCQILRSVTTYTTNAFGQADQSYLDAETLFTLMYIVRFLKQRATQKFPRAKLAADGTNFGAGANIVTPNIYRAELIASYAELELAGITQDTAAFQAGLIVQINALDPSRLDVLYDPILVGGLRILALLAEFQLQQPQPATGSSV